MLKENHDQFPAIMEKDATDNLLQTEYIISGPNAGRILTSVTGLFIAVIVTVFPLGYFLISYQYIAGSLVT